MRKTSQISNPETTTPKSQNSRIRKSNPTQNTKWNIMKRYKIIRTIWILLFVRCLWFRVFTRNLNFVDSIVGLLDPSRIDPPPMFIDVRSFCFVLALLNDFQKWRFPEFFVFLCTRKVSPGTVATHRKVNIEN